MREWSVDRFEGALAVLEAQDGERVTVYRCALPPETREGSVLTLQDGAWIVLPTQTDSRRADLFALQESLFDA